MQPVRYTLLILALALLAPAAQAQTSRADNGSAASASAMAEKADYRDLGEAPPQTSSERDADRADLVFSNTTPMPIPDDGCPAFATSTISLPDNFSFVRVELGVQIQHTWRGDLRVQLRSPAGTVVNLIDRVGTGGFGTSADNLDARIGDNYPTGQFGTTTPHTLTPPPFKVLGRPEQGAPGSATMGTLAAFNGQNPQGTWTLGVCDGAGGDIGSLVQWALFFFTSGTSAEDAAPLAGGFALDAAYPNPFAGATTLSLRVERAQAVRAEVYDAVGRRVLVLHDGPVSAGAEHALTLDGSALPAGVYVVRVTGEAFAASRRVLLVR